MISTRDLTSLPNVEELHRLFQSLAMLDAILSPEWEYRHYSFDAKWNSGERMGSMRNGEGDGFFALFTAKGCFLKGFDSEAPMSPGRNGAKTVWPGVLDGVPAAFARCLDEPAFGMEDTTFCFWRLGNRPWQRGPVQFPSNKSDPDGSGRLLALLDGRPETYCE